LPSKGCPVFILIDVFFHRTHQLCGKNTSFSPHLCGE